jgi:hypothetical protein
MPVQIFEDRVWQMSLGERAAVEGILSQLRPALAIEIGTAEGACLQRIAAHAAEVHSFDLDAPSLPVPGNVTLHTGDSHELLPRFLETLADQGRNVDFVMVDGDHTPEGVRQDLEHLLDSPALVRTVILVHDTANERVRAGVDAVRFAAWPKVCEVDLDWIPGRLFAETPLRNELWYGLGLVLVDVAVPGYRSGSVYEQRYHPSGPLLAAAAQQFRSRAQLPERARDELERIGRRMSELSEELAVARTENARLTSELVAAHAAWEATEARLSQAEQRLERADRTLEDVKGSASWRITKPLRQAKRRASTRAG